MAEPTNILGKIGKATGDKIKSLQDQVDAIDVNNVTGDVVVDGDLNGVNLTATGDLQVGGHLVCDSLLVKGETKVVNTTTVEVADNELELNMSAEGSPTANESGVSVNRGTDLIASPIDSYNPDTEESGNDITIVVFKNITQGSMINNETGVNAIAVTISNPLSADKFLTEDPIEHTLVKDLGGSLNYAPIYSLSEGSKIYKIYPIFSHTKDGETFRAGNNQDEKFIGLEEAYLRGYYFCYSENNYDTESKLLEVQIQSISYSVQAEDKARFFWNELTGNWNLRLGAETTNLEAILKAPDGDGVQINGASLGTFADFSSELNSALA